MIQLAIHWCPFVWDVLPHSPPNFSGTNRSCLTGTRVLSCKTMLYFRIKTLPSHFCCLVDRVIDWIFGLIEWVKGSIVVCGLIDWVKRSVVICGLIDWAKGSIVLSFFFVFSLFSCRMNVPLPVLCLMKARFMVSFCLFSLASCVRKWLMEETLFQLQRN